MRRSTRCKSYHVSFLPSRIPYSILGRSLTIWSTIPATAVITPRQLLQLVCGKVDFCPGPVIGAPSYRVGALLAHAADPAAAELIEVAELVGAFGCRVDGGGVGGVVAGGSDAGVAVEMGGYAVVEAHGGVLAWMPLGMADTHVWRYRCFGTFFGRG